MSEKESLGQSIVQAIKFLGHVYEDIGTMVNNLDEAMEKKGWVPTHTNRVSDLLSNSLDPDQWLLPAVYRHYAPYSSGSAGKKVKKTSAMVAILVSLLPPKTHDEAVCLLTAVRFPKPKAYSEIWDERDSGDDEPCGSDRLTEYLAGKDGAQPIPDELLQNDLFAGAEAGVAFLVPLCSLTDAQSLHNKIVAPLLQEANKLLSA